jgi:hypothetical protein
MGDVELSNTGDGVFTGRESHNTTNTKQMKLFNAIAAAAVIGASFIATATPASAQYYGGGYGFNNSSPNAYGNDPYARRRGPQVDLNGWQPTSDFSGRSRSSCSSLSMSQYGC